jgi:hypothetical protein
MMSGAGSTIGRVTFRVTRQADRPPTADLAKCRSAISVGIEKEIYPPLNTELRSETFPFHEEQFRKNVAGSAFRLLLDCRSEHLGSRRLFGAGAEILP